MARAPKARKAKGRATKSRGAKPSAYAPPKVKQTGMSMDAWLRKVPDTALAVVQETASRVVEIAQTPIPQGGRMPIDTNFLRASFVAVLNASMPAATSPGPASQRPLWRGAGAAAVISRMKLGDFLRMGWTAHYAIHLEFGTEKLAPYAFARSAMDQWNATMRTVVAEAKAISQEPAS